MNTVLILDEDKFRMALLERSFRKEGWKTFGLNETLELSFYLSDLKPKIFIFDLATLMKDPRWEAQYLKLTNDIELKDLVLVALGAEKTVRLFTPTHPVPYAFTYPLNMDTLLAFIVKAEEMKEEELIENNKKVTLA